MSTTKKKRGPIEAYKARMSVMAHTNNVTLGLSGFVFLLILPAVGLFVGFIYAISAAKEYYGDMGVVLLLAGVGLLCALASWISLGKELD